MSADALALRTLGSTGIKVTGLCVGTSPLSSAKGLYGYEVDERPAIDTVLDVLDSPIRFLDTSNGYGENGAAERRVGAAIRERGGLPADFVLATKVDPHPATGDFSGQRVYESYRESLERLGVDRVPLLHLHDPERIGFDASMAEDGPVAALVKLRDEGRVDRIGVAAGALGITSELLDTGLFDVVLNHNRYTLLDRSAESLFVSARERGIGVLNAAPYGGGMLSKGPDVQSNYCYGESDPRIIESARAMKSACDRFGVPLAAAALQFSLKAQFVDSTVVGISSAKRVSQTLEYASHPIPDALWSELDDLVPARDAWLE